MNAPSSVPRLLIATFALYRRYPWLFLILATGVILPYELVTIAATGNGGLSRGEGSAVVELVLSLSYWFLITPLISALHVHAVTEVRDGREPQIRAVSAQGLRVLPVVAAVSIISGLGIGLGLIALIVPGVILMLRWAVVAQTAAIEHEGWLSALRRGADLTDANYLHVFFFLVVVGLIATAPLLLASAAFGRDDMNAAAHLTGIALNVVTTSFAALATALLYYDLRVRWEETSAPQPSDLPLPAEEKE